MKGNKHAKTVERLTKRRDWLDRRIAQMHRDNPEKDMGYDKAERNALIYALQVLDRENPAPKDENGESDNHVDNYTTMCPNCGSENTKHNASYTYWCENCGEEWE